VDAVARRHHDACCRQGARYFTHHLFGRTQFPQFSDAKIVGGAQHGWLLFVWKTCRQKQKSRQVWRLFGLPAAIFQIERDPPTASELS
jgi:hypothetical protein